MKSLNHGLETFGHWDVFMQVQCTCSDAGRLPYMGKTFIFIAACVLIHSLATSLHQVIIKINNILNEIVKIIKNVK